VRFDVEVAPGALFPGRCEPLRRAASLTPAQTGEQPPVPRSTVPVTMGSPRFRSMEAGAFSITDAWFPPGALLHAHTHERGIFATMIDGSFDTTILGKRLDCSAGTIWSEPAEERHANDIGRRGARALVVQLDPAHAEPVLPFDIVSSDVLHLRHAGIAAAARRLLSEFDAADDFTPLLAESTVVEMVVTAARIREAERRHHAPPPAWVFRAQEILHEHAREGLQLAEVAALVGEAPWRVARGFRKHFRTSIGEYARALRLTWALDQLAATRAPISEIAHAAGYADQSHFTRACTTAIGIGPAEYRRRGSSARWRSVASGKVRTSSPMSLRMPRTPASR